MNFMKSLVALISLSLLFFVPSGATNRTETNLNLTELSVYFKTGSSKDLARYFDHAINLNINGQQGDYSKNQAEFILKDFFIKYPPDDFKVLHQGENRGPTMFFVGSYMTDSNQFRILIKGTNKGDLIKIFSLEIIKIRI
ncbi:protein of unknown function [Aquiflexum balticum DSM 16537]|uniref:DUF4783 domain-containing protein n=2 Tax=Aquiflexum TaxID=280472 RepID=A0A1W2GZE7_9BACT|nr:protein of unknown function [Aquiflexum balticum DSM 16537]